MTTLLHSNRRQALVATLRQWLDGISWSLLGLWALSGVLALVPTVGWLLGMLCFGLVTVLWRRNLWLADLLALMVLWAGMHKLFILVLPLTA